MATTTARLTAVGHHLGTFPSDGGQWCHEVRRGPDVEVLSEAQARAWKAPGDPAHEPSTLDELVERGLLVRIRPDAAVGFAQEHRLLPLLPGLGPDPDDPDRCHIGAFGEPAVTVDRLGYDLWAEATARRSLWEACRRYPDPHAALTALLERLDTLLSAGAACLDIALPTSPGPE